jgi:glutathionyl-hydroquinone reductase
MGNIRIDIESSAELTVYTVFGEVSAEEIVNVINEFYEGNVTMNVLWDLTESDVSNISPSKIRCIVKIPSKFAKMRTGGKTAIVSPEDFTLEMSRIFELLREYDDLSFKTCSFRTKEEAYQWLFMKE